MPHLTIEHAGLDGAVDMQAVCTALAAAMAATGVFPEGGIRVRAIRCEAAHIADGHPSNAFAALLLRIGAGRDLETRKRAGAAVMAAAEAAFARPLATPHFALSLDMVENDPDLSWKANTIHARLKGQQ